MVKGKFDEHIETLYPGLAKSVLTRHGEEGLDALHDALLSIYENKAHRSIKAKDKKGKKVNVQSFLKRAIYLTLLNRSGVYNSYYGRAAQMTEQEESIDEQTELKADVRLAVGKLSLEQQLLVKAVYWDGDTLREIATRTKRSFYSVFTELEIAKACLRETLKAYAPRVYRVK